MIEQIFVAVTLDNGSTTIQGIVTYGRGNYLPYGATWSDERAGWWRRPATDAVIFEELQRTFPGQAADGTILPVVVRYKLVDVTEIPQDRSFRDALIHTGVTFDYDIVKAKTIHLKRLRQEREYLFEELDAQWMRAIGQNNNFEVKAIEYQRQVLRDLPTTQNLDAVTTIAELKTKWPN